MKIAEVFSKKEALPAGPTAAIKDAWWAVFSDSLLYAVDDYDGLLRARDPEAARMLARCAQNVADAAIDVYEKRFGL